MNEIHYRSATPEDWGAIAQHFHDLWRDHGWQVNRVSGWSLTEPTLGAVSIKLIEVSFQ
ncbi:MAG: hypothetical protein O2890_05890 [Cyanobacteria bacterium]|nr:hypothetical protein [Cyanobacteriota bacterium]